MKYVLNNLDCAHCAAEIERALNKIDGVKYAKVNFMSKGLDIDVENKGIMKKVQSTIKALEPDVEMSCEEEENDGEKVMIIRIIAAALIFFAGFFVKNEISCLLFGTAYVIIGIDIVVRAVKNIFGGKFLDEHFLMTLASFGALATGQYAEAAAVMLFYQIGEFFQDMAVERSRGNIKSLLNLKPEYVNILKDGETVTVKPEEVQPGDIMLVKPGEKISLDGIVEEGGGEIDTSALTGESVPVFVEKGSCVSGGSIAMGSMFKIKITKPFAESTISKILELVENASDRKSASEKFITKFSRYYTPGVVGAAALLAVLGSVITGEWSTWVYRALVFLVISCPCALVISVPLSFFSGVGKASKEGILIKGSGCIERIAEIKTVVFDKTGTLTEGKFSVDKICPADGIGEDELFKTAASCEQISNHPLARSIVSTYGGELYDTSEVREIPGEGVSCVINGKKYFAGNKKLMENNGIECADVNTTAVYIASEEGYCGYIRLADAVRRQSIGLAEKLKRQGARKVVMLTGDNKDAADSVARMVGTDMYYASLMPQDKVSICSKLREEGKLLFLGDGMNDAPVIAMADVGAAMGAAGTDMAIEAAEVVIMNDDPSKTARAMEISKSTVRRVKQNIVFALGVKALILILGACGLAGMWGAVFADVGVSLIAVINAIRK